MNNTSPLLLLGIGTAGTAMARGVRRAFGQSLRYVLLDTDAASGRPDEPFLLLGGDRLSGRGAGGDLVSARLAAEDSISVLDESITGVRLAIILTALGGGTGGGATIETAKHLQSRGIPTIVFATTPFTFEGEDRQRNARGVVAMIEEVANATFFIPLNKLVDAEDNMATALTRGVDTLAAAIALFWRLVEKPGYIKLDTERIRHLITQAGRGRFAVVTAHGETRARDIVEALTATPLLTDGQAPVTSILCGILAGDDLRLSEVGEIADNLHTAFGAQARFELATVNDEATFAGRISVVAMLFEASTQAQPSATGATPAAPTRHTRKTSSILGNRAQGRGRLNNVEPTIWNGQDLDTPTYARHNISLDF